MAAEIETRWQARWEADGVYETPNPAGSLSATDGASNRPKLFIMDMFPYPSGSGLHVGHPLGYIATDTYARFKRMSGFNVLYTMGFDAFGLPAEEHARQTGQHPRVNTESNIANMRRQLDRLGLGHDKRRGVATTDTDYYRWTQWIFLQIFNSWFDPELGRARPVAELIDEFESGIRCPPEGSRWADLDEIARRELIDSHRLAYVAEAPVNWCPALGTVLANEEVTAQGRSERGNHEVLRRPLRQWMMRITAYADRLLADLDLLDWSESIKTMQRNWIGRSEGAEIVFRIASSPAGAGSASNSAREIASSPAGAGARAEAGTGIVSSSESAGAGIAVFTTRPDTLFGTTYMVLAPEHPLVDELVADAWPDGTPASWTDGAASPVEAVTAYRQRAAEMSDEDRSDSKTGVYVGADALVSFKDGAGARVPIFVADYVLMGYGTGAVMGVPGEDQRDRDFAEAFGLPVIRTVQPPEGHPVDEAYTGDGPSINSGFLDGLDVAASKALIIERLEDDGHGCRKVNYRMRDWLFSRQRYWGEPIPIVYDDTGLPVALPERFLPLELPDLHDWAPRSLARDSEPEPPLGRVSEWAETELDLGDGLGVRPFRRELNTMPQWAGSCWYYLRYIDPRNDDVIADAEAERYWMADPDAGGVGGVDLYVGGVEHAVLHLLYARFWHKVLFDLGHVSGPEPFKRLVNQGYILAAAFQDDRGVYVEASEVQGSDSDGFTFEGRPVERVFGKMGKSLRNAVTPDDMYASYGADTLRLYEMFMGPLSQDRPWETRSVVGSQRMLQRVWRNIVDEATGELRVSDPADGDGLRVGGSTSDDVRFSDSESADVRVSDSADDAPGVSDPVADDALRRLLHRTIDGVRADMEGLRFNTAIAKLTELNNELTRRGGAPREIADALVRMLAPLVPHFAEELWHRLHGEQAGSVTQTAFPEADPALLVEPTVEVPVQVNGKLRGRVMIDIDADEAAAVAAALAEPNVAAHIADRPLRKQIYVKGRMITLVA